MKTLKRIRIVSFLIIATAFTAQTKCQTRDTIPNDSYDNFKNQPGYSPSYVVIKSKQTGKMLYEQNIENGKCTACYDKLTAKADSCFKGKSYSDAAILYTSAFRLNDNKGKVKHRLSAACCLVKLNDVDGAFENLDKVVFGAKFNNLQEISSNDCYKPLQKDARWTKLIDGINKNLNEAPQKVKAGTANEQ
jgi:hypothetical protein